MDAYITSLKLINIEDQSRSHSPHVELASRAACGEPNWPQMKAVKFYCDSFFPNLIRLDGISLTEFDARTAFLCGQVRKSGSSVIGQLLNSETSVRRSNTRIFLLDRVNFILYRFHSMAKLQNVVYEVIKARHKLNMFSDRGEHWFRFWMLRDMKIQHDGSDATEGCIIKIVAPNPSSAVNLQSLLAISYENAEYIAPFLLGPRVPGHPGTDPNAVTATSVFTEKGADQAEGQELPVGLAAVEGDTTGALTKKTTPALVIKEKATADSDVTVSTERPGTMSSAIVPATKRSSLTSLLAAYAYGVDNNVHFIKCKSVEEARYWVRVLVHYRDLSLRPLQRFDRTEGPKTPAVPHIARSRDEMTFAFIETAADKSKAVERLSIRPVKTIGDGSCLLHAVLQTGDLDVGGTVFHKDEYIKGADEKKGKLAESLRRQLANLLSDDVITRFYSGNAEYAVRMQTPGASLEDRDINFIGGILHYQIAVIQRELDATYHIQLFSHPDSDIPDNNLIIIDSCPDDSAVDGHYSICGVRIGDSVRFLNPVILPDDISSRIVCTSQHHPRL